MNVYREQTAPLENYYQERGLLTSVDGMADIAVVQEQIIRVLRVD
jgi:adenylate kinase